MFLNWQQIEQKIDSIENIFATTITTATTKKANCIFIDSLFCDA